MLLWRLMGYCRVAVVVVVVDAALLDSRTIPSSSSSSSRNRPWEIPDDDKDDKINDKDHHTQKQKQPNGKEENREVEEDDDENDEEEQQEDEEEEEEEDDEEELWTEHERMEDLLSIEFSVPMDTTNHHDNTQQLVDAVLQGSGIVDRLQSLLKRATTMECRTLIAQHYGYFVAAVGREHTLPFAHWDRLESSCPRTEEEHQDDVEDGKQDDDDDDETRVHPDQLQLLYVILTHDDPQSTIRLVQTLSEPNDSVQQQPHFVIHVDGKPASDETFAILSTFAKHQSHVHVVPGQHRVRVTWGGFGLVQATLVMLKYAFGLLSSSSSSSFTALNFDKVIHLSGSTYPIASNREIRHVLSHYPLDSNFLHIPPKPCKFHVDGTMWTLLVTHITHKACFLHPVYLCFVLFCFPASCLHVFCFVLFCFLD